MDPKDNYKYCVVSAFTSGEVNIDTDDLYHTSYDVNGSSEYDPTTSDLSKTSPIITVTYNDNSSNKYTGKIKFKLSGSSDDDNYAIDGKNSKYNFYQISYSSSYSQMNSGDSVGSALVKGQLPTWAIVVIIIVVIIVIGIICAICFFCCRKSSSSSNNYHEEHHVEAVQQDRPKPVQTNTAPASYYSPPPSQQQPQPQQQQQATPQINYIPPSYNVPPQQPQSSVYGAPPQQSVAPETKEDYYKQYY
ncbi:amelogenin-related protein family [Trichomonas vaginalis G3]|nr:amelogenin-related protein family [Trichomonas vaginalis G3]KAI5494752.1 amelogenin-related protein family [Trichomonas vaginalis G3]